MASPSSSQGRWTKHAMRRLLMRVCLPLACMTLRLSLLFFTLHRVVNASHMPRVKSCPEAPGGFDVSLQLLPFFGGSHCRPLCTHPSFVVISPESAGLPHEVLGCWSWPKPLDHGFYNNVVLYCWCLSSKTKEPLDKQLMVLVWILGTLE